MHLPPCSQRKTVGTVSSSADVREAISIWRLEISPTGTGTGALLLLPSPSPLASSALNIDESDFSLLKGMEWA